MAKLVNLRNIYVEINGETILKNINFSVSRKDKVVILGPNGSGKTTLIKVMLGLFPVTSGVVTWINKQGVMTNLELLSSFNTLTCEEIAEFFAQVMGCDVHKLYQLIKELNLPREVFKKELKKLSYGQKKVFRNLLAITCGYNLTLLDEPFEAVDPSKKAILFNILQNLNDYRAVLIVTHETWLLREMRGWKSYLMIEGKLYGPVDIQELLNSKIVPGKKDNALLHLTLDTGIFSLVPGKEESLSKFVTLDELYITIIGGERDVSRPEL